MEDILLSSEETATLIGVSGALVARWRNDGHGLAFETRPTASPSSTKVRFGYRLSAVLDFLASRGATKTELARAEHRAVNVRRLKLARAADRARMSAVSGARSYYDARLEAADAGHVPSIKMLTEMVRP